MAIDGYTFQTNMRGVIPVRVEHPPEIGLSVRATRLGAKFQLAGSFYISWGTFFTSAEEARAKLIERLIANMQAHERNALKARKDIEQVRNQTIKLHPAPSSATS